LDSASELLACWLEFAGESASVENNPQEDEKVMQQIQVLDHQKSVGISEDSSLVDGNDNDATTAMLQTKTSAAGTIAITHQNLQAESRRAICVDSQLDLLTLRQVDESEMRESLVNGPPSDKKVQLSSGNKSNIKLKKDLSGRERARLEECQVFPRKPFDWEGLRSQFEVKSDGRRRSTGKEEDPSAARNSMNKDGVDWEAVRLADVEVIAEVIKERGFNWILAGRIKVCVFIFCLV
jgi:hypothetical protein